MKFIIGLLFPPKTLQELGSVGSETFAYHYRQTRNLNHDAPTPTKYSYAVGLGKVKVGEAKPVYPRGTRESRMAAWREQ